MLSSGGKELANLEEGLSLDSLQKLCYLTCRETKMKAG